MMNTRYLELSASEDRGAICQAIKLPIRDPEPARPSWAAIRNNRRQT
jgi:hypothetical protein